VELLSVARQEQAGWIVITAIGQLDVATAPGFRQTLLEAQYGGGAKVALDFTGLEFLDSFGLGVVVGGVKRARAHDGELAVVCPPGRTRHVFELTGVDRLLPMVDDLDGLARVRALGGSPSTGGPGPDSVDEDPTA
jgi:anti-sigma B factor antagonist